jgi:threonine dehydrogenase-like Zn-dependent dehydrogenase
MKAIHSFGPKDVRLVNIPTPTPGAGQVLVAVRASGICGSDKWLWRHPDPVTWVIGHEVAGEVVELGQNVRRLRVGDRVAINNVVGCGSCPACRAGVFVKCPHWTGANDVNGGYGEQVVAPERNCLKLAEAVDDETGAQIFDNFGTPFAALERAEVTTGDDVLIIGCGPIGLAAIMLAKLRGAFVMAVDPLPQRLNLAVSLGAEAIFQPGEDTPQMIRELTEGQGAGIVIECSGKAPAYPLGLASLRIGGMFICVGEGAQFDLHPSDQVIRRCLTLAGSWYSSMSQGAKLQEMILQGQITPRILVTHRASLNNFPGLFQKVCEQPDEVIKALIVAS